ncbi:RNA-binding domain-containing protein [Violaceomyces palustris]|uniref:RNA-binding domain-containing protein n=1 Tax=Violaceomyces palustris TaxID=1673888 RepID=A0ACD0NUE6_9BASI|nr:RNA-binding domain-containing protein [Violaceomyces palustris]
MASYNYQASAYPSAVTASTSTSATTSADPYAPFYYWDPTANNWAFDYDSYYKTYGYPENYDPQQAYSAAYAQPYGSVGGDLTAAMGQVAGSEGLLDPNSDGEKRKRGKEEDDGKVAGKLKKGETRETVLRKAAGKIWEDQTLLEWDPSHKRLFIGDLGNDVSDETLAQAFQKYKTFSKARVIRRKHDNKSKGYGFVAFADPEDFLKAWKEMDGKYIGSRPCRIKKANEEVQPVTIGARKDKMLAANLKYEEHLHKSKMGGPIGKDLRRQGGIGKPYSRK